MAHIVENYKDNPKILNVRTGEWDLNSKKEPYQPENYSVDKISIHPNFTRRNLDNDVAILFHQGKKNDGIIRTIQFYKHIQSIQYITSWNKDVEKFNITNCLITGWGENAKGIKKDKKLLRRVDLQIVRSNDDCRKTLTRYTKLGRRFRLHEGSICAVGEENGE